MNLNDMHLIKNGGLHPAPKKVDPAVEMIKKIETLEAEAKARDQKFSKLLEETGKQQEVLRSHMLSNQDQPHLPQPTEIPKSWDELFSGATDQSQIPTVDAVQKVVDMRLQERDRQISLQQRENQKKIDSLRERFTQENPDIVNDPGKLEFTKRTMNEIESINPNLPYEQIYELAVRRTREAEAAFKPAKRQQPNVSDAYSPVESRASMQQRVTHQGPPGSEGWDVYSQRTPEMVREERRQEILAQREQHLRKVRGRTAYM